MKRLKTTSAGGPRLRILIAEDSPGTRHSLNEACSSLPHLTVVGEAADGLETIAAVRALKPDVLTLDINLPRLGGLEVLRILRREQIECRVIVLTSLADEFYKMKCRELHVRHVFDKITEYDRFLEVLKAM